MTSRIRFQKMQSISAGAGRKCFAFAARLCKPTFSEKREVIFAVLLSKARQQKVGV